MRTTAPAFAAALALSGFAFPVPAAVARRPFGKSPGGAPIDLYIISNASGVEAGITTYGAIIVSLKTPGKGGQTADIVLGHDSVEGYFNNPAYLGALIGRYGNRIGQGRFVLNGRTYALARNNGDNHLHGGKTGFDKAVWKARQVGDSAVEMTHFSKDGDEGYPGNLSVTVTYTLTAANELRLDYLASTDRDTVVNLTSHSYFNLAGQGQGDVLKHVLTLYAGRFTPVDAGLIPTGELRPVKGTPLDFTKPAPIGARIDAADPQIRLGGGYDHNFVLDSGGGKLARAAEVFEPTSGRTLEVWTTEPGVQLYTGNFLDGTITGKGGRKYGKRFGFCLETQHFPDSPNKPSFPTTTVKPGSPYRSTTVYKFGVR